MLGDVDVASDSHHCSIRIHNTDRVKEYMEANKWVVDLILAGKQPIFMISGVNWAWSSNDGCMQLQTVFVPDTKFVPPLRIDVIGTMDMLGGVFQKIKDDILKQHSSAASAISAEVASTYESNEDEFAPGTGHMVPKARVSGGRFVFGLEHAHAAALEAAGGGGPPRTEPARKSSAKPKAKKAKAHAQAGGGGAAEAEEAKDSEENEDDSSEDQSRADEDSDESSEAGVWLPAEKSKKRKARST